MCVKLYIQQFMVTEHQAPIFMKCRSTASSLYLIKKMQYINVQNITMWKIPTQVPNSGNVSMQIYRFFFAPINK